MIWQWQLFILLPCCSFFSSSAGQKIVSRAVGCRRRICHRQTLCCVILHVSPVAVGQDQTVWLSAGLLALPAHQPLLACPAPPLAGRLLLIIIIPRQPEGDKGRKERVRKQRDIFFVFFFSFFFFLIPTCNPSSPSPPPQFSFTVRYFKGEWFFKIAL